jgi:hypothetical protein
VAGVVVFVSAANRFAAALSCFSRFCFDIAMIDAIYLYSSSTKKKKSEEAREYAKQSDMGQGKSDNKSSVRCRKRRIIKYTTRC